VWLVAYVSQLQQVRNNNINNNNNNNNNKLIYIAPLLKLIVSGALQGLKH
jgi:hypothetical protein